MSGSAPRVAFDPLLVALAEYASGPPARSVAAREMARWCLLDAMGCLVGALEDPDCRRLVGPLVPGTIVPQGARIPATAYELDPVRAAFGTSALIRWLDFSDTTCRGGHPSDNIGAVLACGDYVSRRDDASAMRMEQVVDAIIKAYEIQGAIASACKLDTPAIGLDAVLSVKVASAAMAARLLGGTREQMLNAISGAWVDGAALNVHRHPPNSGTRKGWAGAQAASSGVALAMMAVNGEMGYPTALSAKHWGFHDVFLGGAPIALQAPLGTDVIEHVIFKLIPCQRSGTTAVEAALKLHPLVADRLTDILTVTVHTHAEAIERIDSRGDLPNAAARDHSLQFMVAAALVHGELTSAHYHEPLAADPRVHALRSRVAIVEEPRYTADYLDAKKRSCANAIEIAFADDSVTPRIEVEYPAGDPTRRAEAMPAMERKFLSLTGKVWTERRQERVLAAFADADGFARMPVSAFLDLMCGE